MTELDDPENDETVGYGRPPIATRFQKGKSGNPKGRPKGRKSVGTIFREALFRKIDVREGERVRTITKIEAAIEVIMNKSLRGDLRAFAKMMDIAAIFGFLELPPSERTSSEIEAGAASAIEIVEQRLARIGARMEAAEEVDAAPGRNSKPEKP